MADLISETPGRVSAAKIDLVAGTRSFIVGLGGALTGITGMMYACGYLVTRAHLNLLGPYGLIEFNHDYILQEGAKFFLATAYSTGREILYPLSIVVQIILPLILLGLFLRNHAQRGWDRLHSRLPRLDIEWWLRVLAIVALFGALVERSETYLDKFEHPLCFSNLLYTDADTPNCSVPIAKKGDGLRDALFRSDKTILDSAFHELAVHRPLVLRHRALPDPAAHGLWRPAALDQLPPHRVDIRRQDDLPCDRPALPDEQIRRRFRGLGSDVPQIVLGAGRQCQAGGSRWLILNNGGGDSHPPAQTSQSGPSPAPDRAQPQTAPAAPAAPTTPTAPSGNDRAPATRGQAAGPRFLPRSADSAATARTVAPGLCCLPGGGSAEESALACAARNGQFYPAGANPNRCGPLVR